MALHHSFAGKKVLITGGGQGIGRQLVQRFHDDGALVYTLDKNPETIQQLREELPNVTAETVDLTDWEATEKLIASFGALDHLVNNAGILQLQNFMSITKETASLLFDVNVGTIINVTQAFAKPLIAAGKEGTVVNLSSVVARMGGSVGFVMYGATKAAVENLTKSMAIDLGEHKIRVNCILPAAADTPMIMDDPFTQAVAEGAFEKLIVKRLIEPNEIVDLIMFLLSPRSAMIVGQGVVIDGGLLT